MSVKYLAASRETGFMDEIQRLCDRLNVLEFKIQKDKAAIKAALRYANFDTCPEVKEMLNDALEQK